MRHIPSTKSLPKKLSTKNSTVSEEDQSDSELEPVEKKEEDFPMENGHAADLWSFENSSIINLIGDYDSEEVEPIWNWR